MRTRIGITVITLLVCAPPAFAGWVDAVEPPSEEELIDLPSLDPAQREKFREYLGIAERYYKRDYWDSLGEKYDVSGVVLEADAASGVNEIDSQARRSVRVSVHPEHDPWLFDAFWRLLDEDPVDWHTLWMIGDIIQRYTEKHPKGVDIAFHMVKRPISERRERPDFEGKTTYSAGCWYLMTHWPENAAQTFAALVTLPHQPDERAILPPHPEAAQDEVADRERRIASSVMGKLEGAVTPEELAEVAEHIEADVEAGAYELDAETAEWLESIRQ